MCTINEGLPETDNDNRRIFRGGGVLQTDLPRKNSTKRVEFVSGRTWNDWFHVEGGEGSITDGVVQCCEIS